MDLSLVPIEALIAEIQSRCEASIIAMELKHNRKEHAGFHFSGGVSACVGLCERFKWQFLTTDQDNYEEDGGEAL